VLRRVHEASGYPSRWPDDPGRWITPRGMVTAWGRGMRRLTPGHRPVRAGRLAAGRHPARDLDGSGRDHDHPQLLRATVPGSGEGAGLALVLIDPERAVVPANAAAVPLRLANASSIPIRPNAREPVR